ncbi:MAG: metal-dependent hydrolase [Wolinella sp.]
MIIKGAIVCDSQHEQKDDVRVRDGKIVDIQKSIMPEPNEEVINADGLWLMPAMIDLNARVANGVLTGKNISTLSQKAAHGGVGTLALTPDCTPMLDSEAPIELLYSVKSELSANIIPLASALRRDREKLTDLSILHKMGCGGIALASELDGNLIRRVCEYSLMLKTPIVCRCEDSSLRGNGVMNDGYLSSRMGLPGIPSLSETKEVAKMIETAIFMKVPMLFSALSSERSIKLISRAKEEHNQIYSEVSIHHLSLSEELCSGFNTGAKILPPLKSESTRKKLTNLLKNGEIDVITSLQSEQSISKKDVAFEEAAFGIDVFNDYFTLCYTYLVRQAKLTLSELSRLTSYNPARILGLNKGYIGIGADADLILVDTKCSKVIEDSLSPYYNTILYGAIARTIVNGKSVYQKQKG